MLNEHAQLTGGDLAKTEVVNDTVKEPETTDGLKKSEVKIEDKA